jgi:hypothetical protein
MSFKIKGRLIYKSSLLGLFILCSCVVKDNTKTEQMNITPGDTLNQIFLQTKGREHISGLQLLITGEIKGSGQLSFGDTDSTTYHTYDLKYGKVEIKYDGDWYSEFCYLTFKPTVETKGQIKVEGDFAGD